MKYRYTKYTGSLLDDIDIDDLVSKLSDLLLSSGFSNPWGGPSDEEDRTMQALHDAILEALFSGGMLSEEAIQQLLGEPADGDQEQARQQLEDLVQQIIERMMEQGFVSGAPDLERERERREGMGGGFDDSSAPVKFEVTDKALDFLGYRALRDLLGSIGRSDTGRHDTRHLSTGVEAVAAPKPYEFGDTLNIDPSSTILNAVRRLRTSGPAPAAGTSVPGAIEVDYPDLMVAQSEYQSSCATVIMLDCSHSMILYGEDRFTPAKRVALALALSGVSGCGYNRIQGADEAVKAAWAEVANQYQRRADLVPNLVATVKGAADFERETLEAVVNARARATSIQVSPEMLEQPEAFKRYESAQGELSSALSRLLVTVERYPDLKANANFRDLQAQLEGTENRIAVARNRYI